MLGSSGVAFLIRSLSPALTRTAGQATKPQAPRRRSPLESENREQANVSDEIALDHERVFGGLKHQIDETDWLRAAATNPAFAFLNDPAEDVYTLADGKPFHDQG